MNENSVQTKKALIVGITIIITVFHYNKIPGNLGMHLFHRELFLIPILMAAFWFGLKVGLASSICISLVYAPHVFLNKGPNNEIPTLILQIFMFNLVGLILGWMVDRERKKQKENDFINEVFGKYVDQKVRDEILSGRIPLDGEKKQVTILFSDLRDFTKLAESVKSKEVVMILNEYFKEMSDTIKKNRGLVLHYIGDEIMAVFGAPVSLKNHNKHAIDAALEMRIKLSRVNLKLANQGYKPLKHGIGVHTGQVVAANIGSPDRLSYTMIGDTVNVASRIQEMNKRFGTDILISHPALSGIEKNIETEKLPPTKAIAISEPLELFKLIRSC
jgi:class 3 adenylate cyclase